MEQTMRAVVVAQTGKAELRRDAPIPELKDYECLARVHTCGFCNGTDLHVINGTISGADGMMPLPTILGHEGVGEVVKLGNKVRHIALGDRFIRLDTNAWYGPYSASFGNMAEYALAVDRQAMLEDGFAPEALPSPLKCGKIPNDISYEDAAVMLSLLECISAVHNFNLTGDMRVLIYGAGPMGMGVAHYLRILGADVTLVDGIQARLDYAAERFDVRHTVNFQTTPVAQVCQKHSFDAVMDLVGSTRVLLEGTDYLKQGGQLCGMGVLKASDALLDVTRLQNNTRLHMLNFPYERMRYIAPLVEMIRSGTIRPKDYYSHVLAPEHIDECVRLIASKEALKVVISFDL